MKQMDVNRKVKAPDSKCRRIYSLHLAVRQLFSNRFAAEILLQILSSIQSHFARLSSISLANLRIASAIADAFPGSTKNPHCAASTTSRITPSIASTTASSRRHVIKNFIRIGCFVFFKRLQDCNARVCRGERIRHFRFWHRRNKAHIR